MFRVSMDSAAQPAWTFRLTGGVVTWLVPLSLILFLGSLALYVAVHWSRLGPQPVPSSWTALLSLAGIFLGVIVVHEALHGIGFRLFGGRPKFGAALASGLPVFYTACPGRRFTRNQFLLIGALPLVAIDVAALALGAYPPLATVGAAAISINSAGAVADLWTIGLLLQSPLGSQFADDDGRSIVAWDPPGFSRKLPRGLAPPGMPVSAMKFGVLLLTFPLVTFPIALLGELFLAEALGGTLRVGGVEVAAIGRRDGHFTAHQNLLATVLVALLLTLAAALAMESTRRWRRSH